MHGPQFRELDSIDYRLRLQAVHRIDAHNSGALAALSGFTHFTSDRITRPQSVPIYESPTHVNVVSAGQICILLSPDEPSSVSQYL